MSKSKLNRIKVALATAQLSDEQFLARCHSVHDAFDGNPRYPTPVVDLPTFKGKIGEYAAAIAEGLDGGKRAKAERARLRLEITHMYESLGQYAQANCNRDIATLISSGFSPVTYARSTAQPLSPPKVRDLGQGIGGELLVAIGATAKARSHELRYTALGQDGIPGPWTTMSVAIVKSRIAIGGLKPGITYAFQVRALGALGFTDWSDSRTRMVI